MPGRQSRAITPSATKQKGPPPWPQSSTSLFDDLDGHEQVVFCHDERSGLRAYHRDPLHRAAARPSVAPASTPTRSDADALRDVLNLSRGMSYKAALAGLDLGGGKAVIIGDPRRDKTEALLRAYGRFVQSLNGRYYTACDVGTYTEDMDVIAEECRFVTGRTVAHGGAGDSSVLTAYGVFQGMRAAAEVTWGAPTLRRPHRRRRRRRQGRPPPGRAPARGRRRRSSSPTSTRRPSRGSWRPTPRSRAVADTEALVAEPTRRLRALRARRRAHRRGRRRRCRPGSCAAPPTTSSRTRASRSSWPTAGILYAPDYVRERRRADPGRRRAPRLRLRAGHAAAPAAIFDTTREVFALAEAEGVPPAVAADRIAEQRMADAARADGDRGIWLP